MEFFRKSNGKKKRDALVVPCVMAAVLAISLATICSSVYASGLNSAAGTDLPIGANGAEAIDITSGNIVNFIDPTKPTTVTAWVNPFTGTSSFNASAITTLTTTTLGVVTMNSTGEINVSAGAGSADNLHLNSNQVWNSGGSLYLNYSSPSNGSVIVGGQGPQNLSIPNGSVLIGGVAATSTTITVANELAAAGVCASNQSLTKTATGFACINVTDLQGVGTTTVPSCPSSQQIYFNGTGFVCQTIQMPASAAINIPNCPAGSFVTANGSAFSCVTTPAGGQVLYVQTNYLLGEAAWNNALATTLASCIASTEAAGNSAAVSTANCQPYYNSCAFNYGGTDGDDNGTMNSADTNDYYSKVNNNICQGWACSGSLHINAKFVFPAGLSAPGQTPKNSVNTGSDPEGRPIVSYNCLYSN